jgi:hypothetical protein
VDGASLRMTRSPRRGVRTGKSSWAESILPCASEAYPQTISSHLRDAARDGSVEEDEELCLAQGDVFAECWVPGETSERLPQGPRRRVGNDLWCSVNIKPSLMDCLLMHKPAGIDRAC